MCRLVPSLRSLALLAMMLTPSLLFAQTSNQAANWCEEAKKSLTDKDGRPAECGTVAKRCIRMNNYWCQKHGATPWRGTAGPNGSDGNQDADGHAVFQSVEWSARAIAMDLRAKYHRGLVSAVDIAAAHSPWCDTLGSKAVRDGSGRTCKDGRSAPPPGFGGPYCKKPESTQATRRDCLAGCNCPPSIAETLVRDLSIDIHADLQLFDATGKPLPNLAIVIRNLAQQEQGVYVRQSVIEAGIARLAQ